MGRLTCRRQEHPPRPLGQTKQQVGRSRAANMRISGGSGFTALIDALEWARWQPRDIWLCTHNQL
jgi:hypothetical protein